MSQGYDGLPAYYGKSSDPITPNVGFSLKGMDPIVANNFVLADTAIGGGGSSSVKINGVTISNPNFNNTTPAAPASNLNVLWQVDGSGNVSAYVPTSGIGTVTSVALTAPAEFSVAGSPITTNGTLAIAKATQTANTVWAGPTTGIAAQPTFRALVTADLPAGVGTVTSVALTAPTEFSVAGSPITTNGTLAITKATQAANTVWAGPTSGGVTQPTFRALVAADLPAGTGTVTSVALTVPASILSVAGSPITTNGTLAVSLATQTANLFWAGPTSGGAATPTFRAIGPGDIPTDTITWDQIGNAAANQTLANGTFTTTFNQTNAAVWTWANTTPTVPTGLALSSVANASAGNTTYTGGITGGGSSAYAGASVTISGFVNGANNGTFTVVSSTTTTITVNNASGVAETNAATLTGAASASSPIITIAGTYSTGAASAVDSWTIQNLRGGAAAAANAPSALTFAHTGSTGASYLSFPAGTSTTPSFVVGLNTNTGGTFGPGLFSTGASILAMHPGDGSGNVAPSFRFYRLNSGTAVVSSALTVTSASGGGLNIAATENTNVLQQILLCGVNGTATGINILLGGNGGNNAKNFTATAGNQVAVQIGSGASQGAVVFNPASGSATFQALVVNPTINQTGTSSGNYTGLLVNVVETALKGAANLLLDLQAGTTGGTSKFAINNSGISTKYAGNTTVSNGIASELALSDLTAQTAAIVATTLLSAPVTGMYRVCWSANITTAASVSSTLGGTNGFQVIYTSPTDSVVKTTVSGLSVTSAANTTATAVGGDIVIYAKTGTNIQFKYDYTSSGTAMAFELHIRLELM